MQEQHQEWRSQCGSGPRWWSGRAIMHFHPSQGATRSPRTISSVMGRHLHWVRREGNDCRERGWHCQEGGYGAPRKRPHAPPSLISPNKLDELKSLMPRPSCSRKRAESCSPTWASRVQTKGLGSRRSDPICSNVMLISIILFLFDILSHLDSAIFVWTN
jgi:hypothetical protein